MNNTPRPTHWYARFGKRVIDLALLLVLAPVWIPVAALVAVTVRVFLGKGVIFRQFRGGFLGQPFHVYKFRTMTDDRDSRGELLPDAERLTKFGRFLRASSLDEIPGLFNILSGDMSIVGPRPLYYDYMEPYPPDVARRHDVRPGVTGWAQVNGRNAIGWEEKFEKDLYYVDNMSLALDLKICFMTVVKVLGFKDISSPTHVTMERYRGPPEKQPPSDQ